MRRLIGIAIACLLAGASSAALADDGYVTGNVTMYAGPDMSYPAVETIPAGEPVAIEGCDDGYGWCDVIWGEDRGWIPGNYIQYEYNGQPVLLPAYAAVIGIPIVTFAIADYWGRYYHNRPFYAQRDRWFNRSFAHRPAPGPFRGPMHNYAHEPAREAVHPVGRPAYGYPAHGSNSPGGHPEYRSSGPANEGHVNRAPPQAAHGQNHPAPQHDEHRDDHGH